jgi:hypothetical protein
MRVSFDVDNTLVFRQSKASSTDGGFFVSRWFSEPLRRGTRALIRELRLRGCSVWIYTSSLRSPLHIRLWLLLHGIRVDGIVNDDLHRQQLSGRHFERLPSKYPPAFNIDLHVDDSEGVRLEAEEHGFRVVIVRPDDNDGAQKVLNAVGPKHAD